MTHRPLRSLTPVVRKRWMGAWFLRSRLLTCTSRAYQLLTARFLTLLLLQYVGGSLADDCQRLLLDPG